MHNVFVYRQGKISKGEINDLKTSDTVWVDITNPTNQELGQITQHTGIEEKQIRGWMGEKKRPAALDYKKYSVLTFLEPVEEILKNGKRTIVAKPCVILISHTRNDLITIHAKPMRAISNIESYQEIYKNQIFSKGATFLLFTLLNEIIEHYYDSLDILNETVQEAEVLAVNSKPGARLMQQILAVKKSIIYFHKALIANREVIVAIENEHLEFLDEEMLREFRILSSSLTQLMEINSTYRDILNSSTEIHLAVISNNLNETMKKITSWGAIILVPSLIAGIFGMNFKQVAAFEWEYGLETSVGAMVLSVAVLYWYFRKKDWL